jgi:hypothetical protein
MKYSIVETIAAVAVWALLKLDLTDGTVITSKLGLKDRLNLLIELGPSKGLSQQTISALVEIRQEFENNLTRRRNELIHGLYVENVRLQQPNGTWVDADRLSISFPRSRSAGGAKATFTSIEEIQSVTNEITTQAEKLSGALRGAGLISENIALSPR